MRISIAARALTDWRCRWIDDTEIFAIYDQNPAQLQRTLLSGWKNLKRVMQEHGPGAS